MTAQVRELKEKAQAFLSKHRHRKALSLYERVIQLSPDDIFTLKKLGEINERLGHNDTAALHYIRLSDVLQRGGRRLQAISSCKLALRASPDHSAATSLLATLYSDGAGSSSRPFCLAKHELLRGPVSPPYKNTTGHSPLPPPQRAPASRRLGRQGPHAAQSRRPESVGTRRPAAPPLPSAERHPPHPPPSSEPAYADLALVGVSVAGAVPTVPASARVPVAGSRIPTPAATDMLSISPPAVANAASCSQAAGDAESVSAAAAKDTDVLVNALIDLCASFSGTTLTIQPPSLTETVTGNTDFLWLIQYTGGVEYTVVVSAQRRFVVGLAQRLFDVNEALVTDTMAGKLGNKLIGIYSSDVKRAFADGGVAVHSGPPIPVSGDNATFHIAGTRSLHIPLRSDVGWVQITVAGQL